MVKVCVRVLARMGRFAEDRILKEARGGMFISGWCLEVYVKCGRGRRIHIWPSCILVRLMTVERGTVA